MADNEFFYIPSLSARTIVYKGLLLAPQIANFYPELSDPEVVSALCLVHQRFSTNTFPTWNLAHPFRYIAHNGEINTLRGNVNWMHARQSMLASPLFGDDIKKLFPIIQPGGSDSAAFDNALELLVMAGRSLPHAMAMLIPEAWAGNPHMNPQKKAFYEYHASLMEPWDGPAAMAFTDGRVIGATLDRNGLRPARYLITKDDVVIMSSETGVLPMPPEDVQFKGRLQPGKMLLADLKQGRIISDKELKSSLYGRNPYQLWLKENQITLDQLPEPPREHGTDPDTILQRQRAFGYTDEDLRMILAPMAEKGEEPIGSMGTDTPLACLSDKPQPLFNYFKQLFAQVTNPPIDPIREEMVMSLISYIGTERNILAETPQHCHTLKLPQPILTNKDLEKLRRVSQGDFLATTLPALFPVEDGEKGLKRALDALCRRASLAIKSGYTLLILSDRGLDTDYAPIPSLLALTAVHNHLVREETRTQVALIIESGEPREVMHFALLIGYGASAINPYLAIETLEDMVKRGHLPPDITFDKALYNFKKSINKGLLKTFSKMGISTLQSYRGAQVFEAIGLNKELVDRYFTGTASRIEGVGLDVLAEEAILKHIHASVRWAIPRAELGVGGNYQYRARGEYHLLNPGTIASCSTPSAEELPDLPGIHRPHRPPEPPTRARCAACSSSKTPTTPVPLEEVEPAEEIVKRFATGAMSFGSISKEAHETLAIAMNRIGGKSNTGEGGEDEARFQPDANGDLRRSAVKQVASRTFRRHHQLPGQRRRVADQDGTGRKARRRRPASRPQGGRHHRPRPPLHARRGPDLPAAPPRHLLHRGSGAADLRPEERQPARPHLGQAGGRSGRRHRRRGRFQGACRRRPHLRRLRRHRRLPAQFHQARRHSLGAGPRRNPPGAGDERSARPHPRADRRQARHRTRRRDRRAAGRRGIRLLHVPAGRHGLHHDAQVPPQHLPGRHRHAGSGTAQEVHRDRPRTSSISSSSSPSRFGSTWPRWASAPSTKWWDASTCWRHAQAIDHWKAKGIDLSAILYKPPVPSRIARRCVEAQDHGLSQALDHTLIELPREPLRTWTPVTPQLPIRNIHRTVGAMLSGEIARRYGSAGLPDNTIRFKFTGSAGQSFGAFLAAGVTLELEGDGNDYVGKGLSGGRIIVYPPRESTFLPEENIVIGNVVLYGATSGEAYFNGMAGERFAVRNSGATAVVEGVGDHGCEYMTKGSVVVLGKAGRNFAAGMSGGIAYVLDEKGDFADKRCNTAGVDLEALDRSGYRSGYPHPGREARRGHRQPARRSGSWRTGTTCCRSSSRSSRTSTSACWG